MKKGFTLIELMIVVAIIGILAAIVIPNCQRMGSASNRNDAALTKARAWASHLGAEGVNVVCAYDQCTVFVPGRDPVAIECMPWGDAPCVMKTHR